MAASDRKGNGSVMFSIGERVVHPVHGAGIIADIVQEKLSGALREYYVFKSSANALTLKIPVSGAGSLRPIMTHEEVDEAGKAITTLGGKVAGIYEYPVADAVHRIVVIEKVRSTPKQYPRKFAKIKQSPL